MATQGYVTLVMQDVALAARHLPTIPDNGSSYLDGAAQTVNAAVDAPDTTPDQQSALLAFLLDIDRARKDDQAVENVAARLAKLTGTSGSPDTQVAGALSDA